MVLYITMTDVHKFQKQEAILQYVAYQLKMIESKKLKLYIPDLNNCCNWLHYLFHRMHGVSIYFS